MLLSMLWTCLEQLMPRVWLCGLVDVGDAEDLQERPHAAMIRRKTLSGCGRK